MSSGKILLTVFLLIFTSTGMLSLAIGNMPGSELAKAVSPFHNVVYGWHLGTWMILGMMANYFWDLCGDNKSLSGASLPALLIPILVSPIVFSLFGRLFKKNGLANIDMVWPLIAFQSGFLASCFQQGNSEVMPSNNAIDFRSLRSLAGQKLCFWSVVSLIVR